MLEKSIKLHSQVYFNPFHTFHLHDFSKVLIYINLKVSCRKKLNVLLINEAIQNLKILKLL